MRKLDSDGCKKCGGQLLVYRSPTRGSYKYRYFRCVDCGETYKTAQLVVSVYQIVASWGYPVSKPSDTIENVQSDSRCDEVE